MSFLTIYFFLSNYENDMWKKNEQINFKCDQWDCQNTFPTRFLCLNTLHFIYYTISMYLFWDCRGRDLIVVVFTTTVQSVPITTKCASSNPVHGEVYSIQHYVIKFVSDL